MKTTNMILILVFLYIFNNTVYSTSDISISGTSETIVSMRILSLPFEGLNNYMANPEGNNRLYQIFNGYSHRRFFSLNSPHNFQIISQTKPKGSPLYLASCFAEDPIENSLMYGFGKYLITFDNQADPSKSMSIIWNTLDSKAGCLIQDLPYPQNRYSYKADWRIMYQSDETGTYVVIYNTGKDIFHYQDTAFLGRPLKEFKIWDMFYPELLGSPLEKKFYARTTPFGVHTEVINDDGVFKMHIFTLGTKVELGRPVGNGPSVYQNTGNMDPFGYNTIIDHDWWSFDYWNSPPIEPPLDTNNLKGYTYVTPVLWGKLGYFKLIADSCDTLILGFNKRLWISGQGTGVNPGFEKGDTLIFKSGSGLILKDSAKIFTCLDGVFIDSSEGLQCNNNTSFRAYKRSSMNFVGQKHIINNGSWMIIDSLGCLRIGDNTTLTFEGNNSYLRLKPNAKIFFGANSKLVFKNGARIIANNVNFSAANPNLPWEGLVFENSGWNDSIVYCNFSNCRNPIKITNNLSSAYNSKIIRRCTFNNISPTDVQFGIYAENVFNFYLDSNTIAMPENNSIGVYVCNYFNPGNPPPGDNSDFPAGLIISNNKIYDGRISILLSSFADNMTTFYVDSNYFYGNSVDINILGRMINGEMKGNKMFGRANTGIQLTQSTPNLLNNIITANNYGLYITDYAYPCLSPTITNDQITWLGGKNYILTYDKSNFNFEGGYAYLDEGQNIMNKTNYPYHMEGYCTNYNGSFVVKGNCWNNSNQPLYNLKDTLGNDINVIWSGSTFSCGSSENGDTYLASNIGFGVFDYTYITQNTNGIQTTPDEIQYTLAVRQKITGDYLDAISSYKNLINNYHSSTFIYIALTQLLECYQKSDTGLTQNERNILYSNLKTFLESKIQTGYYTGDFVDVAFNITLICSANMENYINALNGYEFISLNNPDPAVRLYASWDYAEIQAIAGSGGSESNKDIKLDDAKYLQKRIKRMEKLVGHDPILKKVKESYESKKQKRDNNLNYNNDAKIKDDNFKKEKVKENKQFDSKIESRTISNIRTIKNLTKTDKEKRRLEDILLISNGNKKTDKVITHTIIPKNYELSQNYPNPFNPVTKINYDLPKDSKVKLVIYDLLGREVRTLVNDEFKVAGRYNVEFNGSNLASGVYFYRIQAGDFVSVKRMVLIK